MALIAAGLDFSTLSSEGFALAICNTIDTKNNPEYPLQPVQLGTRTLATDGGEYIYVTTAANYVIGTVGSITNDGKWTFTALTTANATASGDMIGVMSQVASSVTTPTTTNYDCLWVQVAGGCPGMTVASGTAINSLLYSTTAAGVLNSTSASGAVLITGVVTTTTATSASAQPAVLMFPQVALN
jgi:hypothetical protein